MSTQLALLLIGLKNPNIHCIKFNSSSVGGVICGVVELMTLWAPREAGIII
jgi:hypothetical protein